MSTRSRLGFSLVATLALAAFAGACSNQGEGERCDKDNGNLDCQSGLICRRIGAAKYDLCCPTADQTPSVPACSNVVVETVPDAAVEASSEEGDGAVDVPGDDGSHDANAQLDAADATEAADAP